MSTCQAKGLKRAREPKGAVDPPAKKGKKPSGSAKSSTASAAPGASVGHDGVFKGYSLKEIPKEAWPQGVKNGGAHGYTLRAANNAALRLRLKSFSYSTSMVNNPKNTKSVYFVAIYV